MSVFKNMFGDKMEKAIEGAIDETTIDDSAIKRVKGKIIKLSDKGWGFISSKEVEFTRIFFHWTSLKQDTKNFKELVKGMNVEFTPITVKDKGVRAIKIAVVD